MKRILMFLALVVPGMAQSHFLATASTTALTIQQPTLASTTPFSQVYFDKASVYCVAAQTATLSWNGTAATATTLATVAIPSMGSKSLATAWSGSNVGAGTTGPVYNVPAGGTFLIDLSWFQMGAPGAITPNLTITTNGTCTITFTWTEK